MIHTVDQFVMKGGKMKKLHFGSKNQNAAFNMSCVDKKDAVQKSKSRSQGGTPTASPAQCITVGSKEIPYPAKKSRRKV